MENQYVFQEIFVTIFLNSMFTLKHSVGKILKKLPIQKQSQFSTLAERNARPKYGTQRESA